MFGQYHPENDPWRIWAGRLYAYMLVALFCGAMGVACIFFVAIMMGKRWGWFLGGALLAVTVFMLLFDKVFFHKALDIEKMKDEDKEML